MKTPFNKDTEHFFNEEGLMRLDFVTLPNGKTYAFDMRAIKRGEELTADNSFECFEVKDIAPEALELILSSPLMFKTVIAMQRKFKDMGMLIQSCSSLSNLNEVLFRLRQVSALIAEANEFANNARTIPVIGRSASIRRLVNEQG